MATPEPQSGRQTSVSGEIDSRWHSVWRLVIHAEQLPGAERHAFLQSAGADPFTIRQAMAILEGSESLRTAASAFQEQTEERFVPQIGMRLGKYRVGTLLGSGGAGSVYAAFDEELKRPVALSSCARAGLALRPDLPSPCVKRALRPRSITLTSS